MPKSKTAVLSVTNIFEKVLSLHKAKAEVIVIPYNELKDEELIKLVQNGDDDAYAHILQRFQGKIYAYIMRLTNHRDEAHDIAQDVFLKAYKNLHRFDTERKFSSWVYRIAHNESVNWLKKKTRIKMESLDTKAENGYQVVDSLNIEKEFIREEDSLLVRNAINDLSPKYQQIMTMRYLNQMSYDEISKELGKPVNTVGTLINRAKKKLVSSMQSG